MAKVNYGWLKTYNNEYFAPKSILSQLYTDDGVALSTYLFNNYSPRASVGNVKNPVYMDNGDPKACGDLLETNITGISTALATIGTNDAITNVAKGAADTPVYFANGVPVACSGKLAFSITGNADGTATALTSKNIGSATTAPVFFNASGQPQVCTSLNINTSGSAAKLSAADKGSSTIPIYFSGGVPVQCSTTLEVSITGNAGTATNATKLGTARAIDGVNFNGSANIIHYGTCSTAAATVAKEVACTGFTLVTGARIIVKFTVTNTAESPTLNVNSTGAKPIYYRSAAISKGYLAANRTYEFVYNGTQYELVGDVNINSTGECGAANSTSILYVVGRTAQSTGTSNSHSAVKINCNAAGTAEAGSLVATKIYGAVWNDYAEYRKQEHELLPGFCVKSTDSGILNYTTKRLEPCEGVVSDTFGFAIGETDECKTPLAVAGRVLVYTEEDRENFHFGDAVCASTNGRVSKMTREEIKEYPDRIIGIVSEIPDYETWGEGNVAVNNRIWIKVK